MILECQIAILIFEAAQIVVGVLEVFDGSIAILYGAFTTLILCIRIQEILLRASSDCVCDQSTSSLSKSHSRIFHPSRLLLLSRLGMAALISSHT